MDQDRSWLNEQVEREVHDLQDRFGFNKEEALAYWHLGRAQDLIADLTHADNSRRNEKEDAEGGFSRTHRAMRDMATGISRIVQPFMEIRAELGRRVLRRQFPEGWGQNYVPEEPDEPNGRLPHLDDIPRPPLSVAADRRVPDRQGLELVNVALYGPYFGNSARKLGLRKAAPVDDIPF